jgi:hypothetical protein
LKQLVPLINPESILCDFEQSTIKSLGEAFPGAKVSGCLFHLCQSVHRKIGELGLKRRYNTDDDFALAIKCFPALAFVPEEHVFDAFDTLLDAIEVPPEFVFYFENTYVGKIILKALIHEPE